VRLRAPTHPASVLSVTWIASTGEIESVTGTPEHPFWVDGKAAFVPMGELEVGDELVLARGGSARVVSLPAPRGPPAGGQGSLTTYNFEVAEAHTYFIGETGAWVHNAGAICERLKEIFLRPKNKEGIDGMPALQRFMEITSPPESRAFADLHLREVFRETMDDVYVRICRTPSGGIDLTKVPTVDELPTLRSAPDVGVRWSAASIEVHHTCPKYLLERLVQNKYEPLGYTEAQITAIVEDLKNRMPGYLVHEIDHRVQAVASAGPGTGSFHSLLRRRLPYGSDFDTVRIDDQLQAAYQQWGRPEVWEVAREWLRSPGIDLIP